MKRKSFYAYTAMVVLISSLATLCVISLLSSFGVFWPGREEGFKTGKVAGLLERYYLYGTNTESMETGALKGLVDSLGDPYTTYFDSKDYEAFNEVIQGKYFGVGILIHSDPESGKITVDSCMDNSPASKANIRPGDQITAIDGTQVGMDQLDEASELIKGAVGSSVVFTIYRPETQETFDVPLVREEIREQVVHSEDLGNGIGLIRIDKFSEGCDEAFKQAVEAFQEQGITRIVIDLRNNPGGLVDPCIKICDYLLPEGTIVYTQDKNGKKEIWSSDAECADLKLTVLVNEYTASAAEILSAALKDYQKAVIVGRQTYGKGIVQTTFPLSGSTAVKITVAEYFSPSGSKIHKIGVTPDLVEFLEESLQKTDPALIPHEQDNQLQRAVSYLQEQ